MKMLRPIQVRSKLLGSVNFLGNCKKNVHCARLDFEVGDGSFKTVELKRTYAKEGREDFHEE
jgi:hypothetical protein